MSEYTKPCIYCKADIRMSNKNEGKWLPYNLDGSAHDCKPSDQKLTDAQNHKTGGNSNREKKTLTIEERLVDWKRQYLAIVNKRNQVNIQRAISSLKSSKMNQEMNVQI